MNKEQNGFPLIFAVLAFIVGVGLYKEFDFETFRFKNVGLGIVYLITFTGMIGAIVRNRMKKE